MKRVICIAMSFFMATMSVPILSGATETDNAQEYIEGEVIVVYDDAGLSEAGSEKVQKQAEETMEEADITVEEEIAEAGDTTGTVVTAETGNLTVEETIETLEAEDGIDYVQPNYVYQMIYELEIQSGPNDPYMSNQYYLDSTGVKDVWNTVKSSGNITVAVLDTGCRMTHNDLKGNIDESLAYDAFYGKPLAQSNMDPHGHGTHVCGIISADADNGIGIAGISYDANIIPIKVFDDTGITTSTATMVSAYNYLMDNVDAGKIKNLRVINMSVGSEPNTSISSPSGDPVFHAAIKKAKDNYNILSVAAAGNESSSGIVYPSDYDECLSVMSVDTDGNHSAFTNYNKYKDVSAPGEMILSTYNNSDDTYVYSSGTSMATPVVSGIATLLWAENPDLTVDEVMAAIKSTTQPVNTEQNNVSSGSTGIIDAKAAIEAVSAQPSDISNLKLTLEYESVTYSGAANEPSVSVEGLTSDNYDISYSNNINAGTAGVTVTGKEGYTGQITGEFQILPAELSSLELGTEKFTYTGNIQVPETVVTDAGGKTLVKGSDYTVSCSTNRKSVGRQKLSVKGKGNYTGSLEDTYDIVPKGTSIKYRAGITKGFTVRWRIQSDKMATSRITGYQIRYADNNEMEDAKTVTVRPYIMTFKRVGKLKSNQTYYIQVRTYMEKGNTRFSSGWSDVKAVNTK